MRFIVCCCYSKSSKTACSTVTTVSYEPWSSVLIMQLLCREGSTEELRPPAIEEHLEVAAFVSVLTHCHVSCQSRCATQNKVTLPTHNHLFSNPWRKPRHSAHQQRSPHEEMGFFSTIDFLQAKEKIRTLKIISYATLLLVLQICLRTLWMSFAKGQGGSMKCGDNAQKIKSVSSFSELHMDVCHLPGPSQSCCVNIVVMALGRWCVVPGFTDDWHWFLGGTLSHLHTAYPEFLVTSHWGRPSLTGVLAVLFGGHYPVRSFEVSWFV